MQRSRKWLFAALAVSVGLNLVLIGFGAARLLEPRIPPPRLDPALSFFPVLRELPEERQAALRPLMREQFRRAWPAMRGMRGAQREIESALLATPFNEAELAAALAEFRTALLASQQASHGALVNLASALTPEERVRFAALIRAGDRPPYPRRHGEGPERHRTGEAGEPRSHTPRP